MKDQPIVWTIAGSDAGGGAGIQADLLTLHDFGVHGCSVITAVTAQNSVAISHIEPLSVTSVQHQLATLACDLPAQVIKVGMLANETICQTVGDFLATYDGPVVVDPVRVATSGRALLSPSAHLTFIKHIIPHTTLLTPNVSEAQQLTQITIKDPTSLQQAAQKLLSLGAKHVLITGTHFAEHHSQDIWYGDSHTWRLTQPWLATQHTHGSGCSLASALSAALALGYGVADALVIANLYVH
ncbi:MAG: bifunctional hydroxymethylpyrimidine kinase/phosphomethylpyrimidine kinase, partial [Legionellales bacterium]|nr:bifunctional hydroxymethylpyrimidine kinase/phosphomethylpyrimidine kinase [Legionellales bacterium]